MEKTGKKLKYQVPGMVSLKEEARALGVCEEGSNPDSSGDCVNGPSAQEAACYNGPSAFGSNGCGDGGKHFHVPTD